MTKKQASQKELQSGRISLLFFGLLLFAGLLWLLRAARYRYDLIFRSMLIWILPLLFLCAAGGFALLLILWLKGGRQKEEKLLPLPFLMGLTVPLMAAFLFPWLTLFMRGLQFYRLATELVFYAALGGGVGYILYTKLGKTSILPTASTTLSALILYYFYDRYLAPSSMILNTAEFGYMKDWAMALLLIALILLSHLGGMLLFRKEVKSLPLWSLLLPAALTISILFATGLFDLPLLAVRIITFGGMGLLLLWYLLWAVLKLRKKL